MDERTGMISGQAVGAGQEGQLCDNKDELYYVSTRKSLYNAEQRSGLCDAFFALWS